MYLYTTISSEDGEWDISCFEDGTFIGFGLPDDLWDNKDFISSRLIPFLNGRCDEELSREIPSEKKEELRMMFDVAINNGWFENTAAW